MTHGTITVAVPVFNGVRFLEETVAAIQAQSCKPLKIVLGVDVSSDGSADLANRLAAKHPNIACLLHDRQQGFQRNINQLFATVETDYLCFLAQDDWIHPDYVNSLLSCLQDHSSAVLAYSDMMQDDRPGHVQHQASLVGDRDSRLIQYLAMQMNHVEWRGLIRKKAIAKPIAFSDADVIDHLYPLHLAEFGDLQRVPRALYTKRIHSGSVTSSQRQTEDGRQLRILGALESSFECYRRIAAKQESRDFHVLCRTALLARILRLLEVEWPVQFTSDISDRDLFLFGRLIRQREEWIFQLCELTESILKSHLAGQPVTSMFVSLSYFYLATLARSLNMDELSTKLTANSIDRYACIMDYDEFFGSSLTPPPQSKLVQPPSRSGFQQLQKKP